MVRQTPQKFAGKDHQRGAFRTGHLRLPEQVQTDMRGQAFIAASDKWIVRKHFAGGLSILQIEKRVILAATKLSELSDNLMGFPRRCRRDRWNYQASASCAAKKPPWRTAI